MNNKKLKRLSIINLIAGYVMVFLLILLVALNRETDPPLEVATAEDAVHFEDLFNGVRPDELKTEIYHVDGHPVHHTTRVIRDNSVGIDRSHGVILDDDPDVLVIRDDAADNVAVVRNPDHIVVRDRHDEIYLDNERDISIIDRDGGIYNRDHIRGNLDDHTVVRGHRDTISRDRRDDNIGVVDVGALERAIRDRDDGVDAGLLDRRLAERDKEIGINKEEEIDFSGLTLAKDDPDLGDLDLDFDQGAKDSGYGLGKGGELYAYNFPSRGVGAGIGSSAIGAGAGGGAGLSAGIGEGMLNGEAVPTLGGIGTGPAPLAGQAAGAPFSGGVGGLVGGAGAGGAAGLTQGYVTEKLGLGVGAGCAEHGEGCVGGHGHGHHKYHYDHLPKDGALHIMIHVDGSGSILSTRKQLDEMKETLLKQALLPYYLNDEELYDKRVTIVDSAGERTLQFFTEAARKDNVLAIAFQDEAAPDYHLPNFNKFPQNYYSKDLSQLKNSLSGYGGLYRGIMFQVDRGRTFSKSFKEMVECAWNGEGYLSKENLKKYHRTNNSHNIKNKSGIVFSDEYHAKSEGDPRYYLDLIFKASQRVGIDLNIYGAGQTDGHYNTKQVK